MPVLVVPGRVLALCLRRHQFLTSLAGGRFEKELWPVGWEIGSGAGQVGSLAGTGTGCSSSSSSSSGSGKMRDARTEDEWTARGNLRRLSEVAAADGGECVLYWLIRSWLALKVGSAPGTQAVNPDEP